MLLLLLLLLMITYSCETSCRTTVVDCASAWKMFLIRKLKCAKLKEKKNRKKILQESVVSEEDIQTTTLGFISRSRPAADDLKKRNSRGTWTEESVLLRHPTWSVESLKASPENTVSRNGRWRKQKSFSFVLEKRSPETFEGSFTQNVNLKTAHCEPRIFA